MYLIVLITMDTIPIEILFEFFKYLSLKDLIKLEQLNKYFKNIIRTASWIVQLNLRILNQ